jgi:hypothetical protein
MRPASTTARISEAAQERDAELVAPAVPAREQETTTQARRRMRRISPTIGQKATVLDHLYSDCVRALMIAATSLLLLAGCGGSTNETMPGAAQSVTVEEPARPAPKIEGTTLGGDHLSLVAFRGRPVFVNVWSSW